MPAQSQPATVVETARKLNFGRRMITKYKKDGVPITRQM